MQETFDIHGHVGMFGGEVRLRPFPEVLKEVQEHITKNYASTLKDGSDDSQGQSDRSALLIKSYIQKYLEDNHLGVEDTEQEELCELIYGEMTGFSFLTKYLYRDDVEEIINLQPAGNKAKPYQVKQVRNVILKYQLGGAIHEI